jgi:hypothetical protein
MLRRLTAGGNPRGDAVRKRTMVAIRNSMTPAASAFTAAALAFSKQQTQQDDPALHCSLIYRGMEVIFAGTKESAYGICVRTRLLFQSLHFDNIKDFKSVTVSIKANRTFTCGTYRQEAACHAFLPVTTFGKVLLFHCLLPRLMVRRVVNRISVEIHMRQILL